MGAQRDRHESDAAVAFWLFIYQKKSPQKTSRVTAEGDKGFPMTRLEKTLSDAGGGGWYKSFIQL